MRLAFYFFRQYYPSFLFGVALFSFVFLLDKMFDLIDLILNKGVSLVIVGKIFALFVPTAFPLAIPMAILLACMVTFGRLSEENEITAVRAAGISLYKVLWIFPVFALLISFILVPFNTSAGPWINRSFRTLYEQIIRADPLVKIVPKKFFSIKNIKILAQHIDPETKEMRDLFVYQLGKDAKPAERIFARHGSVEADNEKFKMTLKAGQLQRYGLTRPDQLIHTTFSEYVIQMPLKLDKNIKSMRFRNIPSKDLKRIIKENKAKGYKTGPMEAEESLRYALAFAPFCLVMIGIPFATALKRGGKAFSTGLSLVVIFAYYLLLIFGLTMAEKSILPAHPSLWIANVLCIGIGALLFRNLLKK